MANYKLNFRKTGSENVACLLEMLADASAPRRGKISSIVLGNTATPDDLVFEHVTRRITNSGTGTGLTPAPNDPAEAPASMDAEHLITVDPASFAAGLELTRFPCNMRATFQWMANQGEELVWPATATNGIGVGLGAASTSTFAGHVSVHE